MSVQGNFGILVGGGPAPGLNGVISSVTLEAHRLGFTVYGIYDGYKWLVKGDEEALRKHIKILSPENIANIHQQGGSILRTSRTNPVKEPKGIENAVKMLQSLGIQYMVTIGGDDTSFGASKIAEMAQGKIKFAHVPKTIDNDLPLPHNIPTFGYQTARHLGSQLVKNMMADAETTQRWYIIVVMGRTAGHLALGVTKSAGATLAVIPEEFAGKKIALKQLGDIFETSVLKERVLGHNYGVFVIAEGIADCLLEDDLAKAVSSDAKKDAFGHISLADVALGKLLKREIESRFQARSEDFRVVDLDLGYMLRCQDPIPFDQEYTRDLGYQAVQYLLSNKPEHKKNAMICVFNGQLIPMPFDEILDAKTGKTAIRHVDIQSDSYHATRAYMIRLEPTDLENADMLKKLSEAAKITPEKFKEQYQYLVR